MHLFVFISSPAIATTKFININTKIISVILYKNYIRISCFACDFAIVFTPLNK